MRCTKDTAMARHDTNDRRCEKMIIIIIEEKNGKEGRNRIGEIK
jgi:hypothetical protein